MSKIVKISVVNGVSNEVPYSFEMEYSNANELSKIIQHARMLWNDCIIEAETDLFTQSFSHTYSQEVLMNNK
jgi:hypothetical protein